MVLQLSPARESQLEADIINLREKIAELESKLERAGQDSELLTHENSRLQGTCIQASSYWSR
jgi:hypothetical protein